MDLGAGQQRLRVARRDLAQARVAREGLHVLAEPLQHARAATPELRIVRARRGGGVELGDPLVERAEPHQRLAAHGARVGIGRLALERNVGAAHRARGIGEQQAEVGAQGVGHGVGVAGGDGALDHRARAEHVSARGEGPRFELPADGLEPLAPGEILELREGGFVLAQGEQRAAEVFDVCRMLGRALRRPLEAGQRGVVLAAFIEAEGGAEQVLDGG